MDPRMQLSNRGQRLRLLGLFWNFREWKALWLQLTVQNYMISLITLSSDVQRYP